MRQEAERKSPAQDAEKPLGPEQAGDTASMAAEARLGRFEWVVAAVGALFVAAVLGYLAWYRFAHPDSPPKLVAEVASITEDAGAYYVEVRARNDGLATAATVILLGELKAKGQVVEDSEAEIDYLPGHSRREVTLIFTRDPAAHELVLRFKGYARP